MSYLLAVGGLVILLLAGEALLRGAVSLALRLGLSTLVVGLTVVAFGTSAPEMVVSIGAAVQGSPGLATGNVVGSNIANILLILGAGAVIRPIVCMRHSVLRDGASLVVATASFMAFALTGTIEQSAGLVLLLLLLGYIVWSYASERRLVKAAKFVVEEPAFPGLARAPPIAEAASGSAREQAVRVPFAIILIVIGIIGLYAGSSLLIDGAVGIARAFAVPEEVIGLTLVAVGTSLPELGAALAAAARRESDIIFGNVVGSNIFNCLAVVGAAALAAPLPISAELARQDIWVMAAATLLLIPVMITHWRIGRLEGLVFLVLYVGFIGFHFDRLPGNG
jgi:cation:H+ antiporter